MEETAKEVPVAREVLLSTEDVNALVQHLQGGQEEGRPKQRTFTKKGFEEQAKFNDGIIALLERAKKEPAGEHLEKVMLLDKINEDFIMQAITALKNRNDVLAIADKDPSVFEEMKTVNPLLAEFLESKKKEQKQERKIAAVVWRVEEELVGEFVFRWIPRGTNKEADAVSRVAEPGSVAANALDGANEDLWAEDQIWEIEEDEGEGDTGMPGLAVPALFPVAKGGGEMGEVDQERR
ncbi:unnamed protein product [Caenorhabditis bovis]|uniref:Uncharacterized protein n=1 Tax=Caenorhabditis bovis TaxID=2654633 RepID=A0A8S1EFY9_9PELO|nr:unnamed protein product [Caenorhabditis bovis]